MARSRLFTLVLCSAALFVTASTTVLAYTPALVFTKDLRLGQTDGDVMKLQQLLNMSSDTVVASSGPGSPGHETDYFGMLTKAAVIRFQEKYASSILQPVGLTAGTGFVGSSTRAKLNSLSAETDVAPLVSAAPSAPSSSVQTPPAAASLPSSFFPSTDTFSTDDQLTALLREQATEQPGDVVVAEQSSQYGPAGSVLVIHGFGFASSTDPTIASSTVAHFGDADTAPVVFNSDVRLSVTVPVLPYGKYPFWISNKQGQSSTGRFFVVTNPTLKPPVITSVSPTSMPYGGTITVTGENFTPLNEVWTEFGVFDGIPSVDGKTLSFTFASDQVRNLRNLNASGSQYVPDTDIPVFINIINEGGATVGAARVMIQLRKDKGSATNI